jgi:hypothetical protein
MSDERTVASLLVCVLAGAWFWWRSGGHPAPVIEPALLRVRTFAWANPRNEDGERALRAGFDMHVPKPVEEVALLAVIAAALERPHGG